jgi:hypothetical protein
MEQTAAGRVFLAAAAGAGRGDGLALHRIT